MANENVYKPIDRNGVTIAVGDWVGFEEAPPSLLRGLLLEDQDAIKAQEGTPMQIVDFDKYGYVEMEFTGPNGTYRTIWVEPENLFKMEAPVTE